MILGLASKNPTKNSTSGHHTLDPYAVCIHILNNSGIKLFVSFLLGVSWI